MTNKFCLNCMLLILSLFMGVIPLAIAQQIKKESSILSAGKEDFNMKAQIQRDKEIAAINDIRASSLKAVGKESLAQSNAIHLDAERKIKEIQNKYEELIKMNSFNANSSTQNARNRGTTVAPSIKTYTNFADSSPTMPVQKERELSAKAKILNVLKSHGKSK